ncbi:MAG TPA: DinB family protein [Micropruina sp.]|nr:DinB family protein [Micropruina sp.]
MNENQSGASVRKPSAVDVLIESFGRIPGLLHDVVDDLDPDLLTVQPRLTGGHAGNSIGWIVWHVGRMEDAQVAGIAGSAEVHDSGGWQQRLGTPYAARTHGYGMSAADVARFSVSSASALTDYYEAVHTRTVEVLTSLDDQQLAAVVDERWTPPVTALVRLVSIVDDAAQHAGQAAYVKGLLGG